MNYNICVQINLQNAGLREGILRRVTHSLGLVEADLLRLYAQVLEYLIEGLAVMAEGYRAVMRIILLHQHMAVEASHLRNREDADGSKGTGSLPEAPRPGPHRRAACSLPCSADGRR